MQETSSCKREKLEACAEKSQCGWDLPEHMARALPQSTRFLFLLSAAACFSSICLSLSATLFLSFSPFLSLSHSPPLSLSLQSILILLLFKLQCFFPEKQNKNLPLIFAPHSSSLSFTLNKVVPLYASESDPWRQSELSFLSLLPQHRMLRCVCVYVYIYIGTLCFYAIHLHTNYIFSLSLASFHTHTSCLLYFIFYKTIQRGMEDDKDKHMERCL